MSKKFTQGEIAKAYAKHGYELISEYKGVNDYLFVKDKNGYICSSRFINFKNGTNPKKIHKNNPYTIQNIKLWIKINNINNCELISTEFKGVHEDLLFKCNKCEEIFKTSWSRFNLGDRCPYCSNHKIKLGINTIWDTDKWMINLGISEKDAKMYSKSSSNIIKVKCPDCGKEKYMSLNVIYTNKSIGCICNDGISYPEKFIASLLDQLNVKYIKEYKPKWSNNKRYDFYLLDYNCIIECHGKQHYNCDFSYCGGRTLQEEQDNDKYKRELASQNGINNYIVLDCSISKMEEIKKNIINSELINILNLNDVNWLKCEEFSLNNRIKEICDYWVLHNEVNNEKLNTKYISKIFKLSRITITRYLKRGSELGWCNYNPKEEMKRQGHINGKISSSKPVEIFKDGNSLGIFPSVAELSKQSERLFNTKLIRDTISEVCRGKKSQYKGFTFKYIYKRR